MGSATYQNLTLALLVLCIVASPIESRYREKDTKKGKGPPSSQPNFPATIVASPLTNLCMSDRDQKLVCHCTPDDSGMHVKAQKANCWIFGNDLPRKDANWLAFQTQSTLEQLKITVQKIGNLSYIPSDVLHTLKYLKQLTIEYGVIPDLLNYAFGNLTELRNVTLHKNQIRIVHPFAFANHPHLEEINLERNEILELDREALVRLPALRKLSLGYNNLTILHEDVFVYLTSLDELRLESNQIDGMTREIFKGLGNLRILKLTANSLSSIGDTIFAELWSLQELDLDHNQIEKLSARAFDGLNNLRKLNLENNRLKRLERGIFTGVPAVLNLNLNSNQLETITYQNFLPLMDNLVNSTAMLHLKENRFICDCRLLWLFDLRNGTKNEDLRYTLQHLECLFAGAPGTLGHYGGPTLVRPGPKTFGRSPHPDADDEEYYDGADHRKPAVSLHQKFSSSRSAGDGGAQSAGNNLQDSSQPQMVLLMTLPKDIILPCPKEMDEPTELPLSRESIGLDMGWRSSVTATSGSAAALRSSCALCWIALVGTLLSALSPAHSTAAAGC